MIAETTVIWVGTVALAMTFAGVSVSVPRYREDESSLMGLIAFGFGLLFWILFTLHSTQFIRTLGGGVTATDSAPSFMAVGIIGVILSVLLLFDGALRTIRSNQA